MATGDCITALWKMVESRDDLTDKELQVIADSSSLNCDLLNLAETIEGIGMLINEDSANGKKGSGALQGLDGATLLFTIADYIKTIEARDGVASEAAFKIRQRREQRVSEGVQH